MSTEQLPEVIIPEGTTEAEEARESKLSRPRTKKKVVIPPITLTQLDLNDRTEAQSPVVGDTLLLMSDTPITQVVKPEKPIAPTEVEAETKKTLMQRLFPCFCVTRKVKVIEEIKTPMIAVVPEIDANSPRELILPPSEDPNKKCLVLDLDETLLHSTFKPVDNCDFVIDVEIDSVMHPVYVLKRPFVDVFLTQMAEHFELVVFTASLSKYADPVLDILDPKRLIKHRLFRESCTQFKGNFVKDLSLLGRDLEKTIIVDNSPSCYMFHPANSIPICSWFDDQSDGELLDMIPLLIDCSLAPDVRKILSM